MASPAIVFGGLGLLALLASRRTKSLPGAAGEGAYGAGVPNMAPYTGEPLVSITGFATEEDTSFSAMWDVCPSKYKRRILAYMISVAAAGITGAVLTVETGIGALAFSDGTLAIECAIMALYGRHLEGKGQDAAAAVCYRLAAWCAYATVAGASALIYVLTGSTVSVGSDLAALIDSDASPVWTSEQASAVISALEAYDPETVGKLARKVGA